jgi:hypothetical protein
MYLKVDSPNKASNLSNLMKDGNWIVLYYANWCGHCNTMKPEWQKVISRMKTHNTNCNSNNTNKSIINIADIESSHIDHLPEKPEIAGFPTIKMYNSGNEIANFEDERIADKIHQFAILNSKNTNTTKSKRKSKLRKSKSKSKSKSKKTRKSSKSKKVHKTQRNHVFGASHRLPPKMIDLNMKNNIRMPINISKIIGLN